MQRSAFIETRLCLSRAHCRVCRSSGVVGQKWRAEIARCYRVPRGDTGWTCPWGITGEAPLPTSAIGEATPELQVLVIARLAICERCGEYDEHAPEADGSIKRFCRRSGDKPCAFDRQLRDVRERGCEQWPEVSEGEIVRRSSGN